MVKILDNAEIDAKVANLLKQKLPVEPKVGVRRNVIEINFDFACFV